MARYILISAIVGSSPRERYVDQLIDAQDGAGAEVPAMREARKVAPDEALTQELAKLPLPQMLRLAGELGLPITTLAAVATSSEGGGAGMDI